MARIVGVETEFAVQFLPRRSGDARPTHEAVFKAVLAALKSRWRSCEALYYKGGEFLENGSLVHFEVGRLEDPTTGLLEFATPECLSAREALAYLKAQERALAAAIPEAERALEGKGFDGRIVALKNNRDRWGNDYGTHESYDANERPIGLARRALRNVVHPIVLVVIAVLGVALALPFFALLVVLLVLLLVLETIALLSPFRSFAESARARLGGLATFLVEAGPRTGSGLFPLVFLHALRVAAYFFSLTARTFMFAGHLGPLFPFLVTRQIFAGPGWLSPEGRFELSARAHALRRGVSAYNFGPMRPIVDLKEYFYFRPLSHRAVRKRLHLLVGDANRCEYAEHLKLATMLAVLEALEAGALDAVAKGIALAGGPVKALRAASRGPRAVVARDRATGKPLDAVAVQRRYLEAVWNHFRSLPAVDPDTKEALVRWGFVLDQLEQDPMALDRELDWVLKKRLLDRTLGEEMQGVSLEEAWRRLESFGPANAALEAAAPELELERDRPAAEIETLLRERLGRGFARLRLGEGLTWGDLPAARRAWLRLKVVDLRYHEISTEGGYYDWLAKDGLVARVLEEREVENALVEPPSKTRARIRGDFVKKAPSYRACRVGWDRIVIEPRGEAARTISLADAYRFDL